jgi:hypothetical protein
MQALAMQFAQARGRALPLFVPAQDRHDFGGQRSRSRSFAGIGDTASRGCPARQLRLAVGQFLLGQRHLGGQLR